MCICMYIHCIVISHKWNDRATPIDESSLPYEYGMSRIQINNFTHATDSLAQIWTRHCHFHTCVRYSHMHESYHRYKWGVVTWHMITPRNSRWKHHVTRGTAQIYRSVHESWHIHASQVTQMDEAFSPFEPCHACEIRSSTLYVTYICGEYVASCHVTHASCCITYGVISRI